MEAALPYRLEISEPLLYKVAQKVVHFSTHHIFGTVEDKMNGFHQNVSRVSGNKD